MRASDSRSASGSNCVGGWVGLIQAPRPGTSKSRYEMPKVSPVNQPRVVSSQMQW